MRMMWFDEAQAAGREAALLQQDRERVRSGTPRVAAVRACTLGDGIVPLDPGLEAAGRAIADTTWAFVPASGAATRMFAAWAAALRGEGAAPALDRVASLAVWPEGVTDLHEGLAAVLDRWSDAPKGLVPFHEGGRTAIDEHVDEVRALGLAGLHLTVGADHLEAFRAVLAEAPLAVRLSVQDPATDTLCFRCDDHEPLRDASGALVFRPGGHGALLRNLARVDGRFVLLKNVDNVVARGHRDGILPWRLRLLGHAAVLRERIDAVLLADDAPGARALLLEAFGIAVPEASALARLDRPFRVAGMVPDEGAPGGGPYWVEGVDGIVAPQILEGVQLDPDDPAHRAARAGATHFNPVDMVVSRVGPRGPYALDAWADPSQSLVVRKQHQGTPIVAVERPGLWNGGMAGYNTCFVELPPSVFQPVKTVGDLCRPAHRG